MKPTTTGPTPPSERRPARPRRDPGGGARGSDEPRVLVVDDKEDLARGAALVLEDTAGAIRVCQSAERALELLAEEPADVVVTDIRMDGMGGLSLLDVIRDRWPETRVVLMTGYGTIQSAVDAMRRGASDYLTKPMDADELVFVVERTWAEVQSMRELDRLRLLAKEDRSFHGIHGRDRRMQPVIDSIRRAASSEATVLVFGESGTGKELVAKALHQESARAQRPIVAFSAAAVTESLAEAELFGARRGAYTGSERDRRGLFAEADGGTLFIDEVASMPQSLQGKLLRAIQEREILPVGASTPIRVDVRIIAATNVEPRRLLEEGLVRKDLYYRLSVVKIAIPPLRERPEDVPLLAEVFLRRHAEACHLESPLWLSPRALRLLVCHDWPGNVRELQNVIERAAVMGQGRAAGEGGEIGPGDIEFEDDELDWASLEGQVEAYEDSKRTVVERFQRRYVERLLAGTRGNLSAAARAAGITRAALYKMVKRLDIDVRSDTDELTP